jgi:predicted AlkP superfamily pyrophosphatase or phosphodiesterase
MIEVSERTAVILIDALGFELCDRHGFDPPGLASRTRLRTVLGFSQAALTSMLTGRDPVSHGLWMMYSFASGRSPFGLLRMLRPLGGPDRLWVRNLLNWKLSRLERRSAYFSLYDIPGDILELLDMPARRSVFEPGGGGSMRSVLDQASEEGGLFVRDYNTPEEQAFGELETALEKGRSSFNLVYTAGLDSLLHWHGPSAEEVGARLRVYGERIGSLVKKFPDTRFIVLGDHGMCEVERHVDLIASVEAAGLKIPEDYIPFYDSTMARFRSGGEGARAAISEILERSPGGRVLGAEELESLGVYFPAGEFGDLIFLCEPGTIIMPSFMGEARLKGMHGYHPDAPCMDSVMYSNEEFKEDEARLTGIASFLLPGFRGGVSEP